jgi:hypothetical protein
MFRCLPAESMTSSRRVLFSPNLVLVVYRPFNNYKVLSSRIKSITDSSGH